MEMLETGLESRLESGVDADPYQIIVNVRSPGRVYELCKRVMDVTISLLALTILLPLFIVVALAIILEDRKSSVLFRQMRIGQRGKPFYMYKFRSMVNDAEAKLDELLSRNEINGAMFKMKDDPRVTKVGKWIRKVSIDEFPQFVNVLRGEMSLVGPRPPLPREVISYTPYELNRLAIKPGCTGLWQVSGRNSLHFQQMVELDLEYIRRRSMRLDLRILWRTFILLLLAKNGY